MYKLETVAHLYSPCLYVVQTFAHFFSLLVGPVVIYTMLIYIPTFMPRIKFEVAKKLCLYAELNLCVTTASSMGVASILMRLPGTQKTDAMRAMSAICYIYVIFGALYFTYDTTTWILRWVVFT